MDMNNFSKRKIHDRPSGTSDTKHHSSLAVKKNVHRGTDCIDYRFGVSIKNSLPLHQTCFSAVNTLPSIAIGN